MYQHYHLIYFLFQFLQSPLIHTPNHQPHLLRIGKCIDFWFDAESEEVARKEMDELSDKLFANTVIEDWEYTLEETEETGIGNISNDNAGTSKHAIFDE